MKQPNNMSTAQSPVGRFMVAVGAIIEQVDTGKILIVKRSSNQDWQPGEWEINYGRIDQFESPTDGLRRELREEVGLTNVSIGNILRVWHMFRGPEIADNELVGITYHCTTSQTEITLSHEHSEFAWATPEEALQLVKVEGIRVDILGFNKLGKKR